MEPRFVVEVEVVVVEVVVIEVVAIVDEVMVGLVELEAILVEVKAILEVEAKGPDADALKFTSTLACTSEEVEVDGKFSSTFIPCDVLCVVASELDGCVSNVEPCFRYYRNIKKKCTVYI